jgi:hypothetical protein
MGAAFLHSKSTEVREGALQFLSGQFWRRWSVEHYRPFAALDSPFKCAGKSFPFIVVIAVVLSLGVSYGKLSIAHLAC